MKILIADDHELVRVGLRDQVSKLADDVNILEAGSFDEVLANRAPAETAESLDLILVDLYMPGMVREDPIAALRATCDAFPETPVVVISGLYDTPLIDSALKCGARGFLPKTSKGKTVLSALKLILDGEIYVPPSVMTGATTASPENDNMDEQEAHPVARLSSRERTTLMLLVEGKTNKEIARQLGVTEIAIKMQLRSTYRKLGASNRIDAARIALDYKRLSGI